MYFNEQESLYALRLHQIHGIGTRTKNKLFQAFGTYEGIFHASKKELVTICAEKTAEIILNNQDMECARSYLDQLLSRKIHIVYPGHPSYPIKLLHIYDPPNLLYVRGILRENLRIYNRCIGIVGARYPSVYGNEIAEYFAGELAKRGYTVISGLARGIDGAAHKGALRVNGYTVAVLGCGINVTYPKEHVNLFHEIEERGAVISEYGLDEKPLSAYFPQRNRIISGMSDGVLVVEAKKKSGSLITCDRALEQGRQVYAVPGRITDKTSEGCNDLIKQGAICVTGVMDIVDDMEGKENAGQMIMMLDEDAGEMVCKDDFCRENEKKEEITISDSLECTKNALAPMNKIVYSCLSLDPLYIDDIIQLAGIGITKVISILYELEEQGLIKQPLKGYYTIAL
ncbi:MAG: DNA-processing protein DprA [Eubacteriales bacterium]|nr:DNA-processing protein DprA [Eubacteriales bacterium]